MVPPDSSARLIPVSNADPLQCVLDRVNEGEPDAWDRLVQLVYGQLRVEAARVLHGERNTLQTTAVLHEALLRLQLRLDRVEFQNPSHFFGLVSREIRCALLDHIRARRAQKRGGGLRVGFDPGAAEGAQASDTFDFADLHDVLEKLRSLDERQWLITELKFFCGYTNEEAAAALGQSVKSVEKRWTLSKAWLRRELGEAQ